MRRAIAFLLGTTLWMQVTSARAAGEGRPSEGAGAGTHDGERVEPVTRTRDRNAGARLGLIIGGSVTLTAFYGLPCATGFGLWCVPVAGPVLVVAKREREQSSGDDGSDGIVPPAFVYALAGGLGMLQLAGAALVTTGALLPRREVTERVGPVAFVPLLSSSTAGLAAVGTW